MAVALLQSTGTQRSGQSVSALSLTFTSTTTSGSLLVVVTASTGNIAGITDSFNNTGWRLAARSSNGNQRSEIWYCPNATGGASHQISIMPSASIFLSAAIIELSGVDSPYPLDQTATNSAATTSIPSGTVQTSKEGMVLVAGYDQDASSAGTPTVDGAWTSIYNQAATSTLEGISAVIKGETATLAAGQYTSTWTISSGQAWCTTIASFFKAAPATVGKVDYSTFPKAALAHA